MHFERRRSEKWFTQMRASVVERLRARRSEIEEGLYRSISAVSDAAGGDDPEYQAGLRAAITGSLCYALDGIARGGPILDDPLPPSAAEQARRAARYGVRVGTVLRRYMAGFRLLGEFVAEEAERLLQSDHGHALQHLRRTQDALLEHIIGAIEDEYHSELGDVPPELQRRATVDALLSGAEVDAAQLDTLAYGLDAWHIGVVGLGTGVRRVVKDLAARLNCQLLSVEQHHDTLSAWLGGNRKLAPRDIERGFSNQRTAATVVIGRQHRGIDGFRLTHQEAQAALPVAARQPGGLIRSTDVVLEAAVLGDATLFRLLQGAYLAPLDDLPDKGRAIRATLRAYFDAEYNVAETARSLGLTSRAVRNRLAKASGRLGYPIPERHAELEVALRLEAMSSRRELTRTPS